MLTTVNARGAQFLDAQRKSEGLRAFAQSLSTAGLGFNKLIARDMIGKDSH